MPRAKKLGRKPRPDKQSKIADVVRLAGTGLTWRAIAEQVGVAPTTAFRMFEEYFENEHALLHDDADRIRKQQTATLLRAQRLAEKVMLDFKVITEDKATGLTVELADFERIVKSGNLIAKYSAQIAMMNGANKPLKVEVEGGGLPAAVFAALAEARMKRAKAP